MRPGTRVHPRSVKPLLLAAALLPLAGCAEILPASDAPVPTSEPRAVVRLEVDLARAQDCEEAFDLALYRSRAIDLVSWYAGGERCKGRTVTIRYLPRQASRDEVLRAAQGAAEKVNVLPPPNGESR
jgi:hypothetical protein